MLRPVPSDFIQLGKGRDSVRIPILHEDRSVMAIDKPSGWLLAPQTWDRTPRNLELAISAAVRARIFWVRSRNLSFLRHVHRLDADTTGVLLLAKSAGGVRSYADLFRSRKMAKTYLAVVHGRPRRAAWVCQAKIARHPDLVGRMRVDVGQGKEAETAFRVLKTSEDGRALIEAKPITGRTHQIRLHLLEAGLPIVGDRMYGPDATGQAPPLKHRTEFPMGLRAVALDYFDPFLCKEIHVKAPVDGFLRTFGWASIADMKQDGS